MPLPDADPDKRMYKLLKNIDLENLTFAQFQTTAESVFAEPEAEDTLRRIVLINLARMSVAGDWNGLTTSGGGGTDWNNPSSSIFAATDDNFYPAAAPPWGGSGSTTSRIGENDVGGTVTYPIYYPFISPLSGSINTIGIRTNGTDSSSVVVGIFANTADNGPGALIGGQTTLSLASSTTPTASPASTVTLVEGSMYWAGYVMTTSVTGPMFYVQNTGPGLGTNTTISLSPKYSMYDPADTGNTLPSTAGTSGYVGVNRKIHLEITWS